MRSGGGAGGEFAAFGCGEFATFVAGEFASLRIAVNLQLCKLR